jgi:hypothetical protein
MALRARALRRDRGDEPLVGARHDDRRRPALRRAADPALTPRLGRYRLSQMGPDQRHGGGRPAWCRKRSRMRATSSATGSSGRGTGTPISWSPASDGPRSGRTSPAGTRRQPLPRRGRDDRDALAWRTAARGLISRAGTPAAASRGRCAAGARHASATGRRVRRSRPESGPRGTAAAGSRAHAG